MKESTQSDAEYAEAIMACSEIIKAPFDRLIERISSAIKEQQELYLLTEGIQQILSESFTGGQFELPESICERNDDRYGRRLLHRDQGLGFSVVAMIWGPGQGTKLHDHAGIWCVEGVTKGRIHIEHFRVLEKRGDHFRFIKMAEEKAGIGVAGNLIPPHEYHIIRNDLAGETSITIHVYGGDMTSSMVFEPTSDREWYRGKQTTLSYR